MRAQRSYGRRGESLAPSVARHHQLPLRALPLVDLVAMSARIAHCHRNRLLNNSRNGDVTSYRRADSIPIAGDRLSGGSVQRDLLPTERGAAPPHKSPPARRVRQAKDSLHKANSAFMRSRQPLRACLPSAAGMKRSRGTWHSHSDLRNSSSAFGGRYRAGLTSGCFRRASALSFIARSASTYMCVVDGLS